MQPKPMKILVLNSGSSSQKSCLYEIGDSLPDDPPPCLWQAKIEWRGEFADAEIKSGQGSAQTIRLRISSRAHAIEQMLDSMWQGESKAVFALSEIDVVGHRVVHGGPKFEDTVVITPEVKSAIADVSAFAPLHNRAELEGMETIEKLLGKNVPQVAVFDTGFHKNMPLSAAVYPGPYDWFGAGIRRYGFHGINHKYCARRASHLLRRDAESLRLVSCHLGNGCSLAAIRKGKSVDTTMGFTPLEGLMMGTRSGSVDPGILTYLMRQHLSGEQLDDLLNQHSGLLGVSGISGDMREILQAVKSGHERAKLAFDIYVHRLQSGIGAMIAVLGGVDALIFTAGVGENSPEVRAAACDNLRYAGVEIDPQKNAQSTPDCDISTTAASVRVLTIRAQEDWEIARDCWKLEK